MPSLSYRPDVDGLRAVSVLGVLLFHAGLGVSGGFVGVDVFFVISGFLITSILFRELESGTFTLADFWVRRIRRILPAISCLVFVVLAVGYFTLDPKALRDLSKSSIAQSLISANIFFYNDIGYFAERADYKPLLHTWSLAVEEQFYLFYPLVVTLLFNWARKLLVPVLCAVAIASLVLSIYATPQHQSACFFLLPARAWELLAGGLIAIWHDRITLGRNARELFSMGGARCDLRIDACLHQNDSLPWIRRVATGIGRGWSACRV